MNTGLKTELKRKAIHLTGLTVPAIYLLTNREFTLAFITVAFVVFVVLEPLRIIEEIRDRIKVKLRLINPEVATGIEVIEHHVTEIEREHEREGVAAHIYFTLASLIVVYFFSREIAIAAVTVATIGDAAAAIIGKNFGRHRFSNGKSLEGSLAYFISALLIIYPLLGLKLALVGALVGTIVEFYDLPPDDNFSNQVFVALSLYLFSLL